MSWLYFSSVIVSIYLLLLLIGKPDKTTADKILIIWQFFATLHLAGLYFIISGRYHEFPYFLGWSGVFPLVHGPFLHLYILHLTAKKKPAPMWLLHFLPVVLISICWLPFLLLHPQQKIRVFDVSQPIVVEAPPARIKYKGSTLTEGDALKIQEQLSKLMEQEQLYTNPELTLGEVARLLQVHDAILSQVINSKFDQNFYDYINSLRVEAFVLRENAWLKPAIYLEVL